MNQLLLGTSIVGVVWLMYARTIWWGEVVDDKRRREEWERGLVLRWIERIKYSYTIRDRRADRVVCIAIHSLVCVLVWIAFGMDRVAMWSALIFAVHPVSLSVAVWLNGKRYGLNTLIVLLVYAFPPLTLPLLILVPRFQANALPAPLLFLRTHPLYLLIGLVCLIPRMERFMKWWKSRKKRVMVESTRWYARRWVLMVRTMAYYAVNGVTGWKVGMYHEILDGVFEDKERTRRWTKVDSTVVGGIGLLFIIGWLTLRNWNNQVGEGLWWWFIFSLVFSNWTTVTQSVTDRYCYLPLIGLVVSVCTLVVGWECEWLLGGWLGWLIACNLDGARAYEGVDEFVDYHLEEMPKSSRVWIQKVNWERKKGNRKYAIRLCVEGLRRFGWCEKMYYSGVVLLSLFDYPISHTLLVERDVERLMNELGKWKE